LVSYSVSWLSVLFSKGSLCEGYYATGTLVALTALCRPLPNSRKPEIVDILKVDLRPKANRARNLVRLINLCSLIVPLTIIIGLRTNPEFRLIRRCLSPVRVCTELDCNIHSDGKTIEICGTNVKKTYDGPERHARIQKLRNVYEVLRTKDVPNVDRIVLSYADDKHGTVAFLEPKGISVIPKSVLEVLEAVSCILDALIVCFKVFAFLPISS
jgi:hypothetical protein